MLENEHKVLRFAAKMVTLLKFGHHLILGQESGHKEDEERKFVITFRLADDMMTIYEPPERYGQLARSSLFHSNAGILGGKFLERTHVLRPGATHSHPSYYTANDLYIGASLEVFNHKFVLTNADDYVFHYMEENTAQFPKSDTALVLKKLRSLPHATLDQLSASLSKAELAKKAKPVNPLDGQKCNGLSVDEFVSQAKKSIPVSDHV